MNVVVVLNQPQDIVNIAVVIRAMNNFELRDLRLVAPADFSAIRIEGIAHKSGDVLERVQIFESLDEALSDCTLVAGLTARGRTVKRNVQRPREVVAELRAIEAPERGALLFGREDKGLTNEDLDRCHRTVTIPTAAEHTSLNLAQAATIMLYELFNTGEPPPFKRPRREAPPATHKQLELLFHDAEQALAAIEFFKSRNPEHIMRSVREVVHRTPLDGGEAGLMRAMCLEVLHYLKRTGRRS